MNPNRPSGSVGRPRHRAARLLFAVAAVALVAIAGRVVEHRLSLRRTVAEGEAAFGRGDFRQAAAKFRSALDLDPGAMAVRLRLLAAYHELYVPGGESRANLEIARRALDEIAQLLERDPSNRAAIALAAEIEDGRSGYVKARDWYRRLEAVDSSNAAAFAGASAAALKQVTGAVFDVEARAGLLPAAFALRPSAPTASGRPIANDDVRTSLLERWSATIAEGIDSGTRALTIDPGNDAVMLTLSAWHELVADLAGSPDEYQRHMTSAADWRHRALEIRHLKAGRNQP